VLLREGEGLQKIFCRNKYEEDRGKLAEVTTTIITPSEKITKRRLSYKYLIVN
jgi:hypothetical protein